MLDGATGNAIQDQDLKAADFGGAEYEGCNEHLVLTRPDVITHPPRLLRRGRRPDRDGHLRRHAAGAGRVRPGGQGLRDQRRAAGRARGGGRASAAGAAALGGGLHGPHHQAITVTGGVTFDELATTTIAGGPVPGRRGRPAARDAQDTRNVKAGLLGIERAFAKLGRRGR